MPSSTASHGTPASGAIPRRTAPSWPCRSESADESGPGIRSTESSRLILRRTTNRVRRDAAVLRSSLVASWINLDLAEILHRLPPQFLKAFRQAVREFAIPDPHRRESALSDEGRGR